MDFARWFRREEDDEQERLRVQVEVARERISFSSHPEYEKLMDWLSAEIDRPGVIGDHGTMLASMGRVNGLKEVRNRILRRVKESEEFIDRVTKDMQNERDG